ncbi:MAG: small, acid-soluble spore protein, alpha/beta type [Eubacteriales bacterium]|jgi:small acid-soluble spore protein F (minor alpha/beta-type SASP)
MMSRRGIMGEHLKEEIARELGVYDVVSREGWGGVSSRNCGNMVTQAIQMAQRAMEGQK